jgi:fluoride exporter
MREILLVGLGGFVGSVGRYLMGGWVQRLMPPVLFPWGTLAVNVVGCLGIGLASGILGGRPWSSAEVRLAVTVGLLGGFTTFSAFGAETLGLARAGEAGRAAANVVAQLVLGLAAVWLGDRIARGL